MVEVKTISSGIKEQMNIGMNNQKTTYYNPTTTQAVLDVVSGLDLDDLVLLRIELAAVHLSKTRTKSKADQMMKNRIFWNWWLRIWESMDQKFLEDLRVRSMDSCDVEYYKSKHLLRCTKMRWVYKAPKESIKV